MRIAQGVAQSSDVNVVLFEKESMDDPTSVRETTFTEKGTLQSWPYGFFEADLR